MSASARPSQQTLRQLRQARGWTQQDVAEQVGVGRKQVYAWERGEHFPRPATRQRLAKVFGVGVGEIAFGQSEEESYERP